MSHEERNKSRGHSMTNKERNSRSKTKSHERSILRTSHRRSSEGTESHSSSKTDNRSKSSRSSKRDNRRYNRSYREPKRDELFSIRSTLNYLVEEVHILKMKQSRNNTTVNRDESVSPELTVQSQRKVLQDMTIEQFKSFRDEIIQILADLDDSLSLDHTKPWNKIYKHVSKNIMPAVDKVLNSIIWYNPTELKYALQQLHHHRRENWQISQDDEKSKADKKRKGTNARRSDKKERQKRRFLHMYNTNDPVLLYSQPNSLSDKKYKKDIEELATNGAYHSDEMSEIDEEKMQKEIAKNV
ncbi:uncharacterized protein OCT59_018279 [Rhizophagus irregularis]|uniref:Uncharacterized protein n=1 Tax=Rhizophagus irregularis (strain DAOM 197198w) TaxID=1432141 RepID=A0A015IV08_RHIIW|nr:hypothetical protein RirG_201130 [Rhizophagus irregularis DAOM 197198w]UZO26030.1 hypothetical protein OCT59_018279 [Rhizophagus irregularis]GBC42001.1 hypothetical protein GLOIN_2v1792170 [Rhizophagus irregularis DAOM 181602=DAOM 197198]